MSSWFCCPNNNNMWYSDWTSNPSLVSPRANTSAIFRKWMAIRGAHLRSEIPAQWISSRLSLFNVFYKSIVKCGIKTKSHLPLHIFHDISTGDPARNKPPFEVLEMLGNMQKTCGCAWTYLIKRQIWSLIHALNSFNARCPIWHKQEALSQVTVIRDYHIASLDMITTWAI